MNTELNHAADAMLWALALSEAYNTGDPHAAHTLAADPPGAGTGLGFALALVSLLIDLRAADQRIDRDDAVAELRGMFTEAAAQ